MKRTENLLHIMNSYLHKARKRSRSSEEEDFLPLSKKINNLHINKWYPEHDIQMTASTSSSSYPLQQQMQHPVPQVPVAPQYAIPPYSPDLSMQENPYYYETNKFLYDLYVARSARNPHTGFM